MEHRLSAGDRLVVASHNRGKLKEFETLLAPHGLSVLLASDLGLPEPDETGTTFEENALIKALAAAEAAKMPALADDSGVVVEALGGEPGVYSARWAGPGKDFRAAMARVEDRLREAGAVTPEKRGARFVAVLCLAFPDGASEFYRGEVAGTLVWPPRGSGGFGYDPMFVPVGLAGTFAEITAEEKHAVSHRARAFASFAEARLIGGREAPSGATGTNEKRRGAPPGATGTNEKRRGAPPGATGTNEKRRGAPPGATGMKK